MDKDKENVDGNLSVDVVKSSQGSPFTSNTQSLHLELLDEDVDTSEGVEHNFKEENGAENETQGIILAEIKCYYGVSKLYGHCI